MEDRAPRVSSRGREARYTAVVHSLITSQSSDTPSRAQSPSVNWVSQPVTPWQHCDLESSKEACATHHSGSLLSAFPKQGFSRKKHKKDHCKSSRQTQNIKLLRDLGSFSFEKYFLGTPHASGMGIVVHSKSAINRFHVRGGLMVARNLFWSSS